MSEVPYLKHPGAKSCKYLKHPASDPLVNLAPHQVALELAPPSESFYPREVTSPSENGSKTTDGAVGLNGSTASFAATSVPPQTLTQNLRLKPPETRTT